MALRSGRRASGSSFGGDLLRGIVITLFIISLAVVFVLYFRPLYYMDIPIMHLDTACGKDAATVRRNYDAICDYMFFWNRGALVIPDFPMSEHGRIHFADCKRIFDVVQILCIATGIWTIVDAAFRKHTARCLYLAAALTILIPAVAGVLAVFRWDDLFTAFHSVLFTNNYWLFNPRTDPVILILPDGFFFQCAVILFIIVLAGGVICLVKALRKARYGRRR